MRSWDLSVDLGTSYCVGAIATDDGVQVLEVGGESRVPSTVLHTDDGRLLAGRFAERSLRSQPERAERNPKRYVGRTSPMLLGGRTVTVTEALAVVLELFVDEGRRYFDGADPDTLVLTHPAAWSSSQRDRLEDVANRVLPGVRCRLLPEPVAAAWYYATDRSLATGESVGVYDLGGGTFDVAVLRATESGFDVLGSDGDPEIGGENFDSMIYGHFGEQLVRRDPQWWDELVRGTDRRSLSLSADLLDEARRAKEELSHYTHSNHFVRGADVDVRISRDEFESMIRADVERTGRLLDNVLSESGAGSLSGIFLTGGASRIPLVESTLRPEYGDLVRTWQNPKAAVALGAAHWTRQVARPEETSGTDAAQPTTSPVSSRRAPDGPEVLTGSAAHIPELVSPPEIRRWAAFVLLVVGALTVVVGIPASSPILLLIGLAILIASVGTFVFVSGRPRMLEFGAPVRPTPPEPR